MQQSKSQVLFKRRGNETQKKEPIDPTPNSYFSGVSVDLLALTFDPNSGIFLPRFFSILSTYFSIYLANLFVFADELPANFKGRKRPASDEDYEEDDDQEEGTLTGSEGEEEGEDVPSKPIEEEEKGEEENQESERRVGNSHQRVVSMPSAIPTSHHVPIYPSSSSSSSSSFSATTSKPVPPSPAVVSKALQAMNDFVSVPLPTINSANITNSNNTKKIAKLNNTTTTNNNNATDSLFNIEGIIPTDEYEYEDVKAISISE